MSKRSTPTQKGRKSQAARFPTAAVVIGGIVVLAIIAVAAILLTQNRPTTAATTQALPTEISPTEAATMHDAGAILLDVREQSEWDAGHVAGATLIPLGQLESRMSELPKDKDIVVMCRTGVRSAQGRDILLKAGYPRVTSVKGGITAWTSSGLPTVSGN
jgi:rhodanese-related sulfurtransferase